MNLRSELDRRMSEAFLAAGIPADVPVMIALPARPEFGDYQANGVMAAAKRMGANPRQLAEKVVEVARPILADLAGKVEVAGPGFINIHLSTEWLSSVLNGILGGADGRLGVPDKPERRQTVVVDYSAPNLAKEMHVGHLRSTIIGDALARVLYFVGHKVIRQNHVGDWGTQYGMLVAYLKDLLWQDPKGDEADTALGDLEEFYRQAKARFDADPGFADIARQEVVQLQAKEPATYDMWARFREISLRHCKQVYERLGVLLTDDDICGESFYNDDLPRVVADLKATSLFRESQGAQCVFLVQFKGKDGELLPVIVQKSDEGYLYATTDLAAIRYRCGTGPEKPAWAPADRILYVTDARQSLHFRMLFAVAKHPEVHFAPENVSLEHVPFGTMMGADGRPFKTRTGGTVKLMDLLDEAQQRALAFVSEKSPDLPEDQRLQIARVVGIGAVKYADLSQNRSSDYVFSWDKMLSLDGNTAPYMQYAYARVRSIFRKGVTESDQLRGTVRLAEPAERVLGLKLAQFPETVETVARDCLPSVLCAYLYDLAGGFMGFYESCPVLKAGDEGTRASRLLLCELTARTIQTGLNLLGIETIEQM